MDPTNVVGRRVAALLIDGLIVAAVAAASWFAFTKQIEGPCFGGGFEIGGDCRGFTADSPGRGLWFLVILLASATVYWILPGLTGSSPGKAAAGIRVVSRDGGKPGLGKALVRWLMYIVDGFPYIIPHLVGFVTALTDDQHRRVGDRVAGTLVVAKNAADQPLPGGGGGQHLGQYGGSGYQQQGQQGVPAAVGASGGSSAPGWYDDPQRMARLRYWDGSNWTTHTSG